MMDEHALTLRQADQIRGDLYAVQEELEWVKAQLTSTADAIGPRPRCARDRPRDDDADDVEHLVVRGGLALLMAAAAE